MRECPRQDIAKISQIHAPAYDIWLVKQDTEAILSLWMAVPSERRQPLMTHVRQVVQICGTSMVSPSTLPLFSNNSQNASASWVSQQRCPERVSISLPES